MAISTASAATLDLLGEAHHACIFPAAFPGSHSGMSHVAMCPHCCASHGAHGCPSGMLQYAASPKG